MATLGFFFQKLLCIDHSPFFWLANGENLTKRQKKKTKTCSRSKRKQMITLGNSLVFVMQA
jgi:hypothetical protein